MVTVMTGRSGLANKTSQLKLHKSIFAIQFWNTFRKQFNHNKKYVFLVKEIAKNIDCRGYIQNPHCSLVLCIVLSVRRLTYILFSCERKFSHFDRGCFLWMYIAKGSSRLQENRQWLAFQNMSWTGKCLSISRKTGLHHVHMQRTGKRNILTQISLPFSFFLAAFLAEHDAI